MNSKGGSWLSIFLRVRATVMIFELWLGEGCFTVTLRVGEGWLECHEYRMPG